MRFTQLVKEGVVDGYGIAHGWTQSSGRSGGAPYIPPSGWMFDPTYRDISGAIGSHGGCPDCSMTLVHLITILSLASRPLSVTPAPTPPRIPPETIPGDEWGDYPVTPTPSKTMMYVVIALALLGTYMILRR